MMADGVLFQSITHTIHDKLNIAQLNFIYQRGINNFF